MIKQSNGKIIHPPSLSVHTINTSWHDHRVTQTVSISLFCKKGNRKLLTLSSTYVSDAFLRIKKNCFNGISRTFAGILSFPVLTWSVLITLQRSGSQQIKCCVCCCHDKLLLNTLLCWLLGVKRHMSENLTCLFSWRLLMQCGKHIVCPANHTHSAWACEANTQHEVLHWWHPTNGLWSIKKSYLCDPLT